MRRLPWMLLPAGILAGVLVGALLPRSSTQAPSTPNPSGVPSAGSANPSATATPGPGDPELGGAVWYPPQPTGGVFLIAAADASAASKGSADVVVSGSADDEINAALTELGSHGGGEVKLSEGRFELARPVVISGDGLALVGVNVGNGAGYSESALGSQLVPAESFPDDQFLVQATPDAYGPLISLIHIDGLDRAQGMDVEGIRPTVSLTAVSQSSGVGIRFAGASTGRRPYDGFALFNRVFDGHGVGILNDELAGDMLLEGNVVFRNDGDGFLSRSASLMYRMNHAYNNGGVGIRLIPGCVRTRLSSNKWEGNAEGGISIEGGSAFTIVGDTLADNNPQGGFANAQIAIGVAGDRPTTGVLLSDLAFGKGNDANAYLIHFGSLARDVSVGPISSQGGFRHAPFLEDRGSEVHFYGPIPDPIVRAAH